MTLNWQARPALWRSILLAFALGMLWIIVYEFVWLPQASKELEMSTRLSWWLSPPLLLAGGLFFGQWLFTSAKAEAAERVTQQAAQQQADVAQQAQAALAKETERQQFTLEVRSVGITLDKYRQMQIWQQLDKVNQPYQSMLSQNPKDYERFAENRYLQNALRDANAFETSLDGWVERWPIPILIAGSREHSIDNISVLRQGAGLAITLFTALGEASGEAQSAKLLDRLFQFFDEHPDIPAAFVFAFDSASWRNPRDRVNEFMVPSMPDAAAGILVTRTDRVDRDIRPYLVDVPFGINMKHTQYDVIKLWNFYWDAQKNYWKDPNNLDWLSWDVWQQQQQTLIAQIDPNAGQSSKLAFWDQGTKGFKPNPWVPVRWTKWQMDQYDDAPILGYLHRPVNVSLSANGQALKDGAKAQAMAKGWEQALATLPADSRVERIIYDTGSDIKRMIPLSRAMAQDSTPHPIALDDAVSSYNLSQRIGNTGVVSPLAMLGLAVMRSYTHGGNTATVNLREEGQAQIIMVSPPSDAQKKKDMANVNKTSYGGIPKDKGPDGKGRNPDPFHSKVQ